MVLFFFDNVIYVFLLLWLCILIICLYLTTLSEVFSCLFLSCKANARVNPSKDGARTALFLIFVLFYVFLCCSMYCLFCVVLYIVLLYMCTELLPPGGYPISVKYIISYIIRYDIKSFRSFSEWEKKCLILIWLEAESASELVASGKANAKFSLCLTLRSLN